MSVRFPPFNVEGPASLSFRGATFDLRPGAAAQAALEEAAKAIRENLERGRAGDGTTLPALRPSTIQRRQERGTGGATPGDDTGTARESIRVRQTAEGTRGEAIIEAARSRAHFFARCARAGAPVFSMASDTARRARAAALAVYARAWSRG